MNTLASKSLASLLLGFRATTSRSEYWALRSSPAFKWPAARVVPCRRSRRQTIGRAIPPVSRPLESHALDSVQERQRVLSGHGGHGPQKKGNLRAKLFPASFYLFRVIEHCILALVMVGLLVFQTLVCHQQRHHKVSAQPVLALFPGKGAPHPLRERTPSWRTCDPVVVQRRITLCTPNSAYCVLRCLSPPGASRAAPK
jgi:hypothetical protein